MLLLDVAQLVEQAFPQIAARDPRRIKLANQFERLVQFVQRETSVCREAR